MSEDNRLRLNHRVVIQWNQKHAVNEESELGTHLPSSPISHGSCKAIISQKTTLHSKAFLFVLFSSPTLLSKTSFGSLSLSLHIWYWNGECQSDKAIKPHGVSSFISHSWIPFLILGFFCFYCFAFSCSSPNWVWFNSRVLSFCHFFLPLLLKHFILLYTNLITA